MLDEKTYGKGFAKMVATVVLGGIILSVKTRLKGFGKKR